MSTGKINVAVENIFNIKGTVPNEEDDEDMLEAGEDYQAIIKVPFTMIEVEEE